MRNFYRFLFLSLVALLLSPLAQALATPRDITVLDPQLNAFTMDSAALSQGSGKANAQVSVAVLLPSSYAAHPERRYPVVYAFHGHGSPVDEMINAIRPYLANPAYAANEFIMVGVAGGNTFYANSAINGNAQQMVAQEVVPLIDSLYRTVAKPSARMVAGFSMGGFGAWNMALANPGTFSWAWVVCPGAFDATGLKEATKLWSPGFWDDYSTTFAPRFKEAGKRVPKPKFNGTADDNALVALLYDGFGGIDKKIAAYKTSGAKLLGVRFDVGSLDYDWITRGSHFIADQMQAAGIPVVLREHTAGHQIAPTMIETGFFPLIGQVIAGLGPEGR